MIVLMISRDENILKDGSDAAERMKDYGALAGELYIVVFSREQLSGEKKIAGNIFVYSTNSKSKWRYALDARSAAMKIIREKGLDKKQTLITTQDPFEAGLAGWCAARKFGIPLQLQIHTDLFSPYFKKESAVNRARVCMAKFLVSKAACIRVVSERIKTSLVARGISAERIVVLPIFVDADAIRNAPITTDLRKKYPQFDFLALMASRFTREKNISMVIAAFETVVKTHPRAGLVIVGDGPMRREYETEIARRRLEKNIVLEKWSDDLASYYKTADVFMITSNYEGYGRTAVEAEAAGCPVIMTDVGIAGEIVKDGENGIVVPVGDAQVLADAITSVAEKKAVLQASLPAQPSKEAYLKGYKRTWERCKKI